MDLTPTSLRRSGAGITAGAVAITALLLAPAAQADTSSYDFEGYGQAAIDGYRGWSLQDTTLDAGFSTNAGAPASFESKSLRVSNSTASSSFNQVYTPPLSNQAGDTGADNTQTRLKSKFVAEFDVASQSGTGAGGGSISVSPTGEGGSRMAFLNLNYVGSALVLVAADVRVPAGTTGAVGCDCADFNYVNLGDVAANQAHRIRFEMRFKDGPSNDVVSIFVDGVKKFTGTSWEDYYRFNTESGTSGNSRAVDRLLFRTRNGAALPSGVAHSQATAGAGMLFDNLSLSSGNNGVPTVQDATAQVAVGGSVNVPIVATDPDGDALALSSDKGTIQNGVLTYTAPVGTAPGPVKITVTANDGFGGTDTSTVTVTVAKLASAIDIYRVKPQSGKITVRNTVSFYATVTVDGKRAARGTVVDVYAKGKKVGTGTVNGSGKVKATLKSKLPSGKSTLKIALPDSSTVVGSSDSVAVKVKK